MTDQYDQGNENLNTTKPQEEIKDRGGLFSFFGKKEEGKPQEEIPQDNAIMADHGEEKKPTLTEKLHRTKSSSSSSSSSEEEVEEGGMMIRRKKKKGLKEKIKQKISSEPEEHHVGKNEGHAIPVVVDPYYSEPIQAPPPPQEENKGLLEKLKEKIPGHHKGGAEPAVVHQSEEEGKKGIMDKIKEKLPGHKDHS